MAPSPSSRQSSPLSEAASSPSDTGFEDSAIPSIPLPNGFAPGAEASSISNLESARDDRSATSSTQPRDRQGSQAPTDLTALTDDEDDHGVDDDGNAEGDEPMAPTDGQADQHGEERTEENVGFDNGSSSTISDVGSLSPPPPSSEVKPLPLPHITLKVLSSEQEPGVPNSQSSLDGEESELESITDSNGDDAEGDENTTGNSISNGHVQEADAISETTERVTDGVRTGKNGESGGVDVDDDEEEDEDEDGDGDITMRADGGMQDLGDQAETETNGDVPPEEDESPAEEPKDAPEISELELPDQDQEPATGEEAPEVDQEQEQEQQDDEQEDPEEEEAQASPALSIQPIRPHSTHAPAPTTAAMKALLSLEVKFAALRDCLYVERMEETAAEEEMILSGSHPAIDFMFKNLLARRERLHEVASRRHRQVLEELARVRDQEKECVWTWWTEERDREQWEEFEQTWAKRRRLIREKSELDAGSSRRHKAVPRSWADKPKPVDWAAGAVPAVLTAKDAADDLARMMPSRQAARQIPSPSLYGYPSNQAQPQYYPHVAHPSQTEPIYASRVPLHHPQPQPQQPQAMSMAQSSASMHHRPSPIPQTQAQPQHHQPQGYGSSMYNTEPRREGRTVPTTSGLFDTARRPASNEPLNNSSAGPSHQPQHPQHQHVTPLQQQPQSQQPTGPRSDSLWLQKQHPHQHQHQHPHQHQHQLQHQQAPSTAMNGKGPSPVHGVVPNSTTTALTANGTQPQAQSNNHDPNGTGNGNGNGNGANTNGNGTAENARVASRYPGLSSYLMPSQAPPRVGALSPPKSSLGISGVPTSTRPFI